MPNEFIARNGIISRGNLIVSGSLVTTQPTTFSGSLSLTGDLNFQPGATRYISMSASPTTASGNSIIIQAGDATASGTGGSVSIQPGGGAGGPGGGTVILSNTTWWNGATVNGLLTVTNQGPNTGTALTVNAGGGIAMKWDWDNINLVNTVSSATNKILRFTGATQYQVRGSGTTFSTTAFQVQNANASASLSVRDDGLVTVGGNIALPVSSYVYWGDANSSVQHTGAAMNFRVYQSGFGWNFIHADTSTTQASINTGFVRAKTGFSSTGNSPVTMSGWDGGGGTAGNTLLVKGGNSGVGAVYTGGNAGDLILENGLATDNSSGNGGTPGSIVFKYGTYNNTASVEYGRLNSSGNFLIGTTAGSAKLLISGSASSTLLKIDSTASSSILVVSGSGRVGIATSTPSATFTVGNTDTVFGSNVGYGAIYGTGSDGIVQIKTDGSSTEMWFRPNNSPSSYNGSYWSKIVQANYSFSIYSGNYQSLTLATGNYPGNGGSIILTGAAGAGTDAITINGPTNAGRVAITTYQSSPITLNGGNVLVGTTTGSAKLTVKGTGATSSSTGLLVQNANLSSSLAVLDNGYVGIGTSSPSTQLEVYSGSAGGTIKVSNSTYSSYWTQGSGFNTTLALSAQGNITWGNGAIFRFYSTGDTTDYRLDSGTFYTNNSQARFYAGHQGYLGFQTIGSSTAYDAIGAVFTDNNTVSLRFFYKNTGSDIEGMRLTSAGLVGIGTTSPSAKLTVQGTGTSSSTTALLVQNSSGTNILTVQDSGQVGIGTTALTGSLDVVGGALVVKTFGSTARGLHLYSNQNTPWRITNNSNTFAIYAPRADTNAAVELINLSDYVDASVPILSFKGGMSGMGYPHYWGINANQTSSYTSDFVVKGTLANTYAIGVATTADKLTAGITPAGGAYFSGSVGIGTNSPAYTLDVSGSTRLNGTGLTTGQHTVATLGFTGGGSTITSIGNAYINFYTRGFRGFDLYNGSSAADTQKVLIGNFVTYGVETARYSAAMLIVESETRGFLPPRTGFTSNISSPGQGLITYVTASTTEGLYYYNSGSYQAWTRVLNDSGSQNIAGNLTVTGSITATGGLTASSAIINGNLTVIGTASFTYTTASVVNIGGNLINLNTDNPAARFGGLTVTDSGSFGTSSTGSLLWDSQNNRWIYSNPSGSSYDGGLLISGPRNTSGLGSEEGTTLNALMKGQGGDHITSSGVFEVSGNVGIGTTTPAAKLDVNGTFKVSSTSTFDSQATFNNANIVATGINSQVGNFVISRANSNTSVEILGGTTSVKLDADNGSASTMFRGVTSIASSYITASAMLHVKGTGTSSSTTALLVQNANTSASLQVYDSGYVVVRQNYGINLAGSVNLWDNIQSVENGALILSPYWGVKINGTYPGGSDQANIPLLHVTRSLSAPLSPLVKFEESGSIRFIINNSGSVGIGTSSPAYTLDTQGSGRFTSGLTTTGSMFMTGSAVRFISNCSVLGGFNHTASGTFSVVAGGQTNKATGTTSGVLSGFCNTVTGQYSTLSGGYYNTVSGNYGGIVSGFLNSTGANKYNIIGGGSANCVTAGGILYGANNTVSAYWSGIVAGCCNTVSQTVSFIGSGRANGVSGACSGVVAGCTNTVSNNNSIIGAGVSNTVSGPCAAILGGESNTAARCYTAVLSGKQNTVSGNYSAFSVIVGGTGSVINGANNTILNGSYNTISAYINSSVIGGVCNTIFNNASLSGILSGDQSLISGSRGFIGSGNANRICATNGAIVNGQSNTLSIGSYSTISNGYQNSITANYGFIGAGRGNSVTAACSSIVGGCANTVSGGYSNIGGGKGNTVSGVISGIFSGQGNVVGNVGGAILYGINNRVCNQASYGGSVIVGGTDNLTLSNSYFSFVGAGKSNTSSGFYNALVAGRSNILSGAYGILGAGQNNVHNSCQGALMAGANNCLTGNNGFIGAGTLNTGSGCFSFTGAGQRNINAAQYGFIGSGIQNYISGIGSVIAGGGGNGQRGNAWDFANCCTYPGNCPSGDYSFVGGGVQNWAGSCLSTVVGGLYNTICSGYTGSFIGGGTCNSICTGDNSVIGGGAAHCLCATRAFLAGGYLNVHKGGQGFMGTGQQNTISGGGQNFLGSGVYNTVSNSYAVIVGGHTGTASGLWASIVGGLCNTASGGKTFIGSGESNTASGCMAAVVAGSGSSASGACSFVGGGQGNIAGGCFSAVAGGISNCANGRWAAVGGGTTNKATNNRSFVGGGNSNTASGYGATIAAGTGGTASGYYSTIAGGKINTASGYVSVVAGGLCNTTSGVASSILGGICNTNAGCQSTIITGCCNTIISAATGSFIGGGCDQRVCANHAATLSGGYNQILLGSHCSAIASGCANRMDNAPGSFIGGGKNHTLCSTFSGILSGCQNSIVGVTANGILAGSLNSLTGGSSGIGAGQNNTHTYYFGFIGAGICNTASCYGSFIGAGYCNTVSGHRAAIVAGSGSIASGNESFIGGGCGNTASGTCTFVGGGYNNTSSNIRAAIVAGTNNISSGNTSIVGGGNNSTASGDYSTVGGGRANISSGYQSVVAGGCRNCATGCHSSALGGDVNIATSNCATAVGGRANTASGPFAAVVGGCNNVANATGSFTGGGCSNTASGTLSFVGSGLSNSATAAWAVVAGGAYNTATAANTFLGSGLSNTVSGNYSTLVGGQSNTVSGLRSSMGGGLANSATGQYTTVAGGCGNVASGNCSAILGGVYNLATATNSFVVGSSLTASMANYTYMNNAVITGSTSIGTTTTGSGLTVYKSGSSVLDIQGSQGQLFSVVDALSGSLMSVNDVSGLPILEVFSDDRVVMGTYGNAALIVTGSNTQISASLFGTRQTGSLATGSTLLYTVNTGSYQAGFFDYYVSSGSNFRAGNIMAVFGAGTYKFTDLATPDIGSTTNLQFSMSMAGASAQLYASASSAGWTVKTTFRTI